MPACGSWSASRGSLSSDVAFPPAVRSAASGQSVSARQSSATILTVVAWCSSIGSCSASLPAWVLAPQTTLPSNVKHRQELGSGNNAAAASKLTSGIHRQLCSCWVQRPAHGSMQPNMRQRARPHRV